VREPLNPQKLQVIVEAHGRFCQLLRPVLRGRRSARSFASKYLHFHCPAVPLYDSVASSRLARHGSRDEIDRVFERPKDADDSYYGFVLWFWQLYLAARKIRQGITVRLLDLYLLWR
jgi:hypothetical protein